MSAGVLLAVTVKVASSNPISSVVLNDAPAAGGAARRTQIDSPGATVVTAVTYSPVHPTDTPALLVLVAVKLRLVGTLKPESVIGSDITELVLYGAVLPGMLYASGYGSSSVTPAPKDASVEP